MTTTDDARDGVPISTPLPQAPELRSFPDPYDLETPAGAEGWEEMYAYHNRFLESRRAEDSAKTWFRNSLHYPEVSYPFDQVTIDGAFTGTEMCIRDRSSPSTRRSRRDTWQFRVRRSLRKRKTSLMS